LAHTQPPANDRCGVQVVLKDGPHQKELVDREAELDDVVVDAVG
jgi:hypothetical protein